MFARRYSCCSNSWKLQCDLKGYVRTIRYRKDDQYETCATDLEKLKNVILNLQSVNYNPSWTQSPQKYILLASCYELMLINKGMLHRF